MKFKVIYDLQDWTANCAEMIESDAFDDSMSENPCFKDDRQCYLVCEVTDLGPHMSKIFIKELLSLPSEAAISHKSDLQYNLSTIKMISKALNGKLSIYKLNGNTTFGFALPVSET